MSWLTFAAFFTIHVDCYKCMQLSLPFIQLAEAAHAHCCIHHTVHQ